LAGWLFYGEAAPSYNSLVKIQKHSFANFIRSLHYWTANAVILSLLMHMARVFINGAYKSPRQVTWWIGLTLMSVAALGFFYSLWP
jgi:ubiquinol-cytochrome c reductase cytochrome b subunit